MRQLACAGCGRAVEHRVGRRPRFCSTKCRNRENGRGRVRKARLGRDTGAPAKLTKKNSKLKALQRAKTLSSYRIYGPTEALDVEVWGGRDWQPAVSSGGVRIENRAPASAGAGVMTARPSSVWSRPAALVGAPRWPSTGRWCRLNSRSLNDG
jgi:hypothetical protein